MAAPAPQPSLSVIALISGGKDSFYSILHCQANGHRVVALANLYPPATTEAATSAEQHQTQSHVQPRSPSSLSQHADHQDTLVPCCPGASSLLPETVHAPAGDDDGETDLNSFMYQTVGHQVIPLYARATGLPLHRQPIVGTAVHQGLNYQEPRYGPQRLVPSNGSALRPSDDHLPPPHDLQGYGKREADDKKKHEPKPGPEPEPEPKPDLGLEDETESLVPLLRTVLKAHPEANALCTGAILSTYQRTRVESVALRLGLVPLSYLWQYTELPTSVHGNCYDQGIISLTERATKGGRGIRSDTRKKGQEPARDDARLLRAMAAVGLEARIVKVASAGLDESFLWENVTSEGGARRVERAMHRFGAAGGRGSILGEGGEFETLVVDGPSSLFKGRIVVSEENRRVIREGGGCAWLSFRRADVFLKEEPERAGELQKHTLDIQTPSLLDPRFEDALQCLLALATGDKQKPGFLNLVPSCSDNTKATDNLGSSSSYSVIHTDSPKCQLPLSPESSSCQELCYLGSEGPGSFTIEQQTVSIVDQIRRYLDERALPATIITYSVIVLRHMSDFPLVNKHYGSLFSEPNPPSRVTISCGNQLLPEDAAIAVYLTVYPGLQQHVRRGLHVQSRSYWAPANIGPYSQAISFPLLPLLVVEAASRTESEYECELQQNSYISSPPFAVSIAGQIPLVPASMTLPPSSTPDHSELQIILALQHLWRVGIEMKVRWWTSAVAYFPATSSIKSMQRQALVAAVAWKAAHLWPELDSDNTNNEEDSASDDDDSGPDLWDRRYNAQFMTHSGGGEEESFPLSLPNWSVLEGLDVNHDDQYDAEMILKRKVAKIPLFFAAEVEELPRQAGVEWHAHLGLAELQPGSVTLYSTTCDKVLSPDTGLLGLNLQSVVVDSGDAVFIQTTATLGASVRHNESQRTSISTDVLRNICTATAAWLKELLTLSSHPSVKPKITYTEAVRLANDEDLRELGAHVPCYSLWDSQGNQLSAVCIFETRVAKTKLI